MSDPDAAFLEDFGFFFINVHDVGGNDVVAEYARWSSQRTGLMP